eukprot:GHVH01001622.1.p1 GENE.GHVH01001622.1~~GHVH01001622.1.p1  ORF type:complete len:285 (-),score=21.85 GHVH01001622.1:480-1334(-)
MSDINELKQWIIKRHGCPSDKVIEGGHQHGTWTDTRRLSTLWDLHNRDKIERLQIIDGILDTASLHKQAITEVKSEFVAEQRDQLVMQRLNNSFYTFHGDPSSRRDSVFRNKRLISFLLRRRFNSTRGFYLCQGLLLMLKATVSVLLGVVSYYDLKVGPNPEFSLRFEDRGLWVMPAIVITPLVSIVAMFILPWVLMHDAFLAVLINLWIGILFWKYVYLMPHSSLTTDEIKVWKADCDECLMLSFENHVNLSILLFVGSTILWYLPKPVPDSWQCKRSRVELE